MKKLLALSLSVALLVVFAGCGGQSTPATDKKGDATKSVTSTTQQTTPQAQGQKPGDTSATSAGKDEATQESANTGEVDYGEFESGKGGVVSTAIGGGGEAK